MLPNWLYGKSKSKLAELLGGGGTPSDYDQVKAQVTQNAEDIALLNNTVEDKVGWNDYSEVGAVNYCKNKATATTTTDGTTTFTWTVNDDKSVTVSVPSYPVTTARVIGIEVWNSITTDECKELVGKTFKLSGCPSEGNRNSYELQAYRVESTDGSSGTVVDHGNGATFTWLNNGSGTKAKIVIQVKNNVTLTGPLTFYPMIAPASYTGPYVPYAKTNREITEKLTANANLGAAVNLSSYSAYSSLYTAPSDGYVHFQSAATGSTARTIYTYGNNTTAATDPHFTHSTSANNKAFEIFIKKGLKIYVDGLQSGDTINFYPLS